MLAFDMKRDLRIVRDALQAFTSNNLPFVHDNRAFTIPWAKEVFCPHHGVGQCLPSPQAATQCDRGMVKFVEHAQQGLLCAIAILRLCLVWGHRMSPVYDEYLALSALRYEADQPVAVGEVKLNAISSWVYSEMMDDWDASPTKRRQDNCSLQRLASAARALRGEGQTGPAWARQTPLITGAATREPCITNGLYTLTNAALTMVELISRAALAGGYRSMRDACARDTEERLVPAKNVVLAAYVANTLPTWAWDGIESKVAYNDTLERNTVNGIALALAMGGSEESAFDRLGRDSWFYRLPPPVIEALCLKVVRGRVEKVDKLVALLFGRHSGKTDTEAEFQRLLEQARTESTRGAPKFTFKRRRTV